MLLSTVALAASCGKEEGGSGDVKEDVVKIVKGTSVCFLKGEYTDESITKAEFTVNYDAKYNLTASLADDSVASFKEVSKSTADGVVSVVYSIESKGSAGSTELQFMNGGKQVDSVPVTVKDPYPNNANFGNLTWGGAGIAYSHDPTILEVPEGYKVGDETYRYFSYSTDNEGGYGVPVKASNDLITWTQLGTCITGYGKKENEVKEKLKAGTNELQEVYEVMSADSGFNVYTLWAPDVVPAANGGYWLYGSWTTSFGSRRSVIFQCYSDSPVGPFEYKGMIVYSPNGSNDGKQSNAIDPSIYYDTEGNMYMSYGSFSDFRTIPLDKETGLRRDGAKFTVKEMTSSNIFYNKYYETYTCDWDEEFEDLDANEKYFGKRILKNTSIEGSVIEYYTVPVYTGAIADYSDSKLTYESNYYLMGSANSLSSDYNMRVFKSSKPDGVFTSSYGSSSGNKISGNFTWAANATDAGACKQLNHYVPGHNDLMITSSNENFIAYHNKISGNEGSLGEQYLYTGLIAFNSNGDMLMSPNRYGGESLRKITADEITKVASGNYTGVILSEKNRKKIYYGESYKFNADGTISGAKDGKWTLYGDNYIYIEMDGCNYYGVVMPGVCTKADPDNGRKGYTNNGGLVISAIGKTDKEQKTLFMQMAF